jgi:hypothetical protein
MKVTLTETGGWTNIRRSCTVDTLTLSINDAHALERALDDRQLFEPHPPPAGARDMRTFSIDFDKGDLHRHAAFTDAAIPLCAVSLLEILLPHCKIAPD